MNKTQLIQHLKQQGINSKILEAMEKIDRARFVPAELQSQAYFDEPLPIGFGQTISQPYTVAFMLQALELKSGLKVLEIGTGSGWNAALISYLIKPGKLYTFEIVKPLAKQAKEKLKSYQNIKVISGNALIESKKYAPYDRIILTAAPSQIPEIFKQQLAESGILLAPIGV